MGELVVGVNQLSLVQKESTSLWYKKNDQKRSERLVGTPREVENRDRQTDKP
jgi:hypothetical protein